MIMPEKMRAYTLRLPENLIVELDRVAASSGVNRASAIRVLLAAAVAPQERDPK